MKIKALKIKIEKQQPKVEQLHEMVEGTLDVYTAQVEFDSEWTGFAVAIIFEHIENKQIEFEIPNDGICEIPKGMISNGSLIIGAIGVKGEQRLSTKKSARVKVHEDAGSIHMAQESFEKTQYERLMEELQETRQFAQAQAREAEKSAEKAEAVAGQVEADVKKLQQRIEEGTELCSQLDRRLFDSTTANGVLLERINEAMDTLELLDRSTEAARTAKQEADNSKESLEQETREANTERQKLEQATLAGEEKSTELTQLIADTQKAAKNAGTAKQSLETVTETAGQADTLLRSTIEDAGESKQELDKSKTEADQSKEALDESIESANTSKSNLDRSKTEADQSKEALDESIESANTSKSNLDRSKTAADQSKEALDESIESANTSKSNLDNSKAAADQAKEVLDQSKIAADQSKEALDQSKTAANQTKEALDLSKTTADQTKEALDTSTTEADKSKQELDQSKNKADQTKVELDQSTAAAQAIHAELEANEYLTTDTMARAGVESVAGRFGGMEDIMLPALVEHYGMDATLKMYVESMQDYVPLADLCNKFFAAIAKSHDKTYTSEFWRFDTNNSGTGWKLDDNAELVCEPSTNTVAGRDDYAAIPLFACYDVNYTIDGDTLEPVIHAIRGVHDSFTLQPEDSFVGVMQMTGWIRRTQDEQKKKVEYSSIDRGQGWNPLPESVRARDNSVRGYVIHAKYTAGLNAAGLLTSASGLIPASNKSYTHGHAIISHDGQIALWRKWGNQYGGSSIVDLEFLQLMLEIKYAELGNDAKMKGCQNYYLSRTISVAEENTTRAILTTSDAAAFVVGSCVSIGTSDNRGAASYDICKTAKILSIEDVEIDGTVYKALLLDVAEPFTTTTTAKVVTQPWMTGGTDAVLGNDGSPINNASGTEPYKLQGIEIQLGLYEVLADTTTYEDTEKYNVYVNRRTEHYRAGGSGVDPVLIGTIQKEEAAGWKYNAELNWMHEHPEGYLLAQTFGGSSSTGYRASTYRDAAATTGWREWRSLGYFGSGSGCGLSCAVLDGGLSGSVWNIGCRACGTAGNRGEFMR